MNCDQVFMVLTRGPFPTGEIWDEEVEAHLETCADCWRLAEALKPALEVFQESVPAAESRDLPGYWGDARSTASVVAELSHASTRMATALGPRRLSVRPGKRQRAPIVTVDRTDTFRTVALATAFLAALAALTLLW